MKPINVKALQMTALCVVMQFSVSAAWAKGVTCESENYGYEYCRVRTENRVRLVDQKSDSACRLGSTWGYDRDGIWVDEGCRAEFEVGRSSSNNNDDDDDDGIGIGTAAAVVGGVALLGALLGGSQQPGQTNFPPPDNNTYGNQGNTGYGSYGNQGSTGSYGNQGNTGYGNQGYNNPVPSWAIGNFSGYNDQYNAQVELNISQNGSVVGFSNGARVDGYFDNGRIVFGNTTLFVEPQGNGFRTVNANNRNNVVQYQRVR